MALVKRDKRFKLSKMLIHQLLGIFVCSSLAVHAFGFDSANSCSPNGKMSRRGRAQLLASIPCDLSRQAYCNQPGSSYPWHAVRRFVHENQGLMKRMYGDVRQGTLLRDELENNEIELDDMELAAKRYSRDAHRRSSKFMHRGGGGGAAAEDYSGAAVKSNDVLMEPHFRPVSTTTTTTTTTPPSSNSRTGTEATPSSFSSSGAKTRGRPTPATGTFAADMERLEEIASGGMAGQPPHIHRYRGGNRRRGTTTTTTTTSPPPTTPATASTSKLQRPEQEDDAPTSPASPTDGNQEDDDNEDDDDGDEEQLRPVIVLTGDRDGNLESNSVYEGATTPTSSSASPVEMLGDNIHIIDSPQLGAVEPTLDADVVAPAGATLRNLTASAAGTISTTLKLATTSRVDALLMAAKRPPAASLSSGHLSPLRQRPSALHRVTSSAAPPKMKTPESERPNGGGEGKIISTSAATTTITTVATAETKKPTAETTIAATPTAELNTPPGKLQRPPTRQQPAAAPTFASPLLAGTPTTTTTTSTSTSPSSIVAAAVAAAAAGTGGASKPQVLHDAQLFQDTLKQPVVTPMANLRGVNACPVKEEVVAPFWANNTRGEVLALLNLYPFEQYVHWEKCTHEHKQMYCRDGCRCEQQFRLHRLLAYDPHNECRGIFSDWFRFPSCCICKCYNVPMDFRPTSRSPRSSLYDGDAEDYNADEQHFAAPPLQPVDILLPDDGELLEVMRRQYRQRREEPHPLTLAEEEVQRAIYEHATEDWYRPRDEFNFDEA